ncbi:hypothetical protein MAPG_00173, partial [Magnaporthiopsis poae ATCC 64411]|uniref:chitinase n=1 Tax=Magnaporthiopsis poae (strain ATCC 64411 / 73-15) TaxID=644358 RepID=A0A0C4DKA7_MAGP6
MPIGLYTHINFAFATVDPVSFKVMPTTQADVNLYKRLMLVKKQDPDLRIFIAIGSWTSNDPVPTATTFPDIAASIPRQRVFIESLMFFISTYGFDGVDMDREYPAADDRSGRKVDFDNFPKFMARLRDSLRSVKKGISITIPASYWYLQHFDLKVCPCSCSHSRGFFFGWAPRNQLAKGEDALARGRWIALCSDHNRADYVLSKLRAAISTINYLNMQSHPDPNGRLPTVSTKSAGNSRTRRWSGTGRTRPARSRPSSTGGSG